MIEYFILVLAIPIGILFAKLTKDEKDIFSKSQYFPVFLWIIAVAAAIFFSINKTIALTLTFIFITVFVWNKF